MGPSTILIQDACLFGLLSKSLTVALFPLPVPEKGPKIQGNRKTTFQRLFKEAVELGRRSIYHATHRDGASGGVVRVYHVPL